MTHVLHLTASAHGAVGVSSIASAKVAADAGGTVVRRDLGADALPLITGDWADARLVAPEDRSAQQAALFELSDTLVAELQAADVLVIGSPIYNFTAPAALKAWMDLIARPGVTFRYTENGPEGLLAGKKAVIVVSSGGVPVGSDMDYLTPHLRFFLGFVGITEVEVVAAKDVDA